jgi:type IV fimbrial biogenesis protein FimT
MHMDTAPAPLAVDRTASQRGFTLIELLTVVAILALLMAAVGPSLGSFAAGQKVKAASYDLTAALLLARSEALKRNGSVRISRVGDSWNNGWTVAVVATDATLNKQGAMNAALEFGDAPESIVFNAYGRVSSPAEPVKIKLASSAAPQSKRCIALSLSGHASSSVGVCS